MTSRPTVLAVTRRTVRKHKYISYLGEFHLRLLFRLRTVPVLVPVVKGVLASLPQYQREMAGLLLVEGEDVEPARYGASKAEGRHVESHFYDGEGHGFQRYDTRLDATERTLSFFDRHLRHG